MHIYMFVLLLLQQLTTKCSLYSLLTVCCPWWLRIRHGANSIPSIYYATEYKKTLKTSIFNW